VILTAHRECFSKRKKRIRTPIGKDSPWDVLRVSHDPRGAQENKGTSCVNSSSPALTSGSMGWRSSSPSRNRPERK